MAHRSGCAIPKPGRALLFSRGLPPTPFPPNSSSRRLPARRPPPDLLAFFLGSWDSARVPAPPGSIQRAAAQPSPAAVPEAWGVGSFPSNPACFAASSSR